MVTTFETTIFSVMMKWGFLIVMVVVSVCAFAQTEQEKLRDVEMQRQANRLRNLERQIDSVALLIDQQQYAAADAKIVNILKTVRSVPSDLTFYLGKTSFYLQKYKQSVDWLNKYIQLKGTSGQFSEEAINLKTKGEVELLKENKPKPNKRANYCQKILTLTAALPAKLPARFAMVAPLSLRKPIWAKRTRHAVTATTPVRLAAKTTTNC
jgi:hypothetical protein